MTDVATSCQGLRNDITRFIRTKETVTRQGTVFSSEDASQVRVIYEL